MIMKKHPYLKLIEKSLKPEYFLNFNHENIMTVSMEKGTLPFAFLMVDDQFDGVVMSLSYDFPETFVVASLTIQLMRCCNVAMGESFYFNRSGNLLWDDQALEMFMLEHDADLLESLQPVSEMVN